MSTSSLVTLTLPLIPDNPASATFAEAGQPVIQLLPDGSFAARDGRPGSLTKNRLTTWTLSPDVAATVLEKWRSRLTPLVIDYEHQSLNTRENGRPAPAAGWIESLTYEPGKGLFAAVKWTDAAAAYIKADEYRYISPVFSFDPKTGAVLELKSAALTNTPALDGLATVAASEQPDNFTERSMDVIPRLKTLFDLPEAATDAALTAELDKLESLLKPQNDGKPVSLTAYLAALTERQTPDPVHYAPVAALTELQKTIHALRGELAALSTARSSDAVNRQIEAALSDGRLTKATEAWARALGEKDPESLNAYLAAIKPIAALTSSQTGGRPDPVSNPETMLTAEDEYICAQLGLSREDFLKAKREKN